MNLMGLVNEVLLIIRCFRLVFFRWMGKLIFFESCRFVIEICVSVLFFFSFLSVFLFVRWVRDLLLKCLDLILFIIVFIFVNLYWCKCLGIEFLFVLLVSCIVWSIFWKNVLDVSLRFLFFELVWWYFVLLCVDVWWFVCVEFWCKSNCNRVVGCFV